MAERRAFEVIETEEPAPASLATPAPAAQGVALSALMLGLKALSQRTVVALSSLFTLATVGSAFVLWMWTPDPSTHQLVGLGMYAMFVLAVNWIIRRK